MRRFAMRLALATGRVDVDGMLRQMTWPQIVEWAAFYQLEPFGYHAREASRKVLERKLNTWFATVVQALYNLFARQKGQPAFARDRFELTWSDLSSAGAGPQYARTPEAQARMSRTLMLIARAYAQKDTTHGS